MKYKRKVLNVELDFTPIMGIIVLSALSFLLFYPFFMGGLGWINLPIIVVLAVGSIFHKPLFEYFKVED